MVEPTEKATNFESPNLSQKNQLNINHLLQCLDKSNTIKLHHQKLTHHHIYTTQEELFNQRQSELRKVKLTIIKKTKMFKKISHRAQLNKPL